MRQNVDNFLYSNILGRTSQKITLYANMGVQTSAMIGLPEAWFQVLIIRLYTMC